MIVQDILDRNGGRIVALSCDASLAELVATMASEDVGSVMLTDRAGRLTGTVSERDLVRFLARNGAAMADITAHELMGKEMIACHPEVGAEMALGLMNANRMRHLPVVDEDRLLGLVSVRDILNLQQETLIADNERRQQDENRLRQAHERLEEQCSQRTNDLRQAVQIAETANKFKSEFLANVSHELRTPLNAVLGFSEMISAETLGPIGIPKYLEYATDITTADRLLLSLINDILDLSKIESGKEELFEEEVIIPAVIRSMMVLVRERAAKEDIELDYQPAPAGDALWADERKVKQILANLLSNAVKFTEPGGKVTIRAWSDHKSGYVIQITDTGIGIARDDIPKALKPFVRIRSELSGKYDGTGLGLPLTKSLVELHGGYLDPQSEEHMGTTVTVRFPANRVRMHSADAAETA